MITKKAENFDQSVNELIQEKHVWSNKGNMRLGYTLSLVPQCAYAGLVTVFN